MTERLTLRDLRTIPEPNDPRFSQNYHGWSHGAGPCIVCGKNLKTARYYVHVVGGGGLLLHQDDEFLYYENNMDDDGSDLGAQPIGPDCYRQYKEQLAGYVYDHGRKA